MKKRSLSVRLTENGEIPVPAELRRSLGLEPRQPLRLSQIDDRILVEKKIAGSKALQERSEQIVKEARLQAARDAAKMTADEVWAEYDAAFDAIRRSLGLKQKPPVAR